MAKAPLSGEQVFCFAKVTAPHGIQGEIKLYTVTGEPGLFTNTKEVYEQRGTEWFPLQVLSARVHQRVLIMKLEGLSDRNAAEMWRGRELFLPLAGLPVKAGNEFFRHEIIGFTVLDTLEGTLGQIREVIEMPAQDVIVMDFKGFEVLIPIAPGIVHGVDKTAKNMSVTLPDGLLEIYMPSDNTDVNSGF